MKLNFLVLNFNIRILKVYNLKLKYSLNVIIIKEVAIKNAQYA